MKMTKKVLSLFLTMLIFSSAIVCSAAATTHTINAAEETAIAAAGYTSEESVYLIGSAEYQSSGDITVVDNRLNIIKEKNVGTSTRQVVSTVTYTVHIQKAGYYRVRINGMYGTTAPTIYMSVDGGTEVSSKPLKKDTDATVIATYFDIAAGQHTLSFKFKGGDASINNIYLKNMQKDVGEGTTQIPIVEYISTNNTSGISDYTSNTGVRYAIPVSSDETSNLGSDGGLNNKYKINVAESGQYRLSAWSAHGKTKTNIYADVSVVGPDGFTILARGIGTPGPGNGTTTVAGVETSSFNLSAGVQTLHLRFHAVNTDPINLEAANMYLYYIELEKIDSDQDAVEISSTAKTEIEPENVFYTDKGITKTADSATISAGKTACFYADVPTDGEYAVSLRYKSDNGINVKVNSFTTNIYKDALIPTNNEYLTYTLSVSKFKAGENRITITPDEDLEIEKIYFNKISDESALSDINAAQTEDALKTAVIAAENVLDVELTDATNGIFYDKPVYNRLLKRDYSSVKDFIAEYNEALISEYDNPWVTLYIDGDKKLKLETGDIKFTASTGYVPKGSTMIVALYENLENNIKTLHNFAICEEVSENEYDFLFGQTEINPEKSYTLEFYYWDGLENVSPIEVFNAVYEEIYVSANAVAENADGTEKNPYPTIQEALEKVAQINDYQWGDIIVNVEDGTYTLDQTLEIDEKYSGKNGYNVIIRGEEGSQPTISGGRKITGCWTQDSEDTNIWKAEISDVDYIRNLYINGYPAVMARSDRLYNTAVSKIDGGTVSTTIYRLGSASQEPEIVDIAMSKETTGIDESLIDTEYNYGFAMSKDELEIDFKHPKGMEFVWPYTFENHITPVTGHRKTNNDIIFYMNNNLLQKKENKVFKTGVSFYLQNAKELINKPGEFCYDNADGYIYYYPYSYEDMNTADVYIGNVEGMVKVAGSSNTSKVENITFENLSFRYGAYNFISKYGYIGNQTDGVLRPFEWSEGNIGYKAQFEVNKANNVNIKGCEFACLGSAAISMIDSVSNSNITGNIIRDISGTGIRIGHPIHNRQRDGVEVCQYIDITNNVIRRIAGETFNNCAITVYWEKFINILHNDIENVPYSGMSIGWGWGGGSPYDCSDIDISYNKIQDVMNTLHDGGGIYTLGPLKNSKISNNYLNGHGSRSGGMIYNDQGSALMEVYNNVVLNALTSQHITNSEKMATQKLKYYNNYSDVGTHSDITDGKEIDFQDHILVTGEGNSLSDAAAKEIYRNAGLESNYQYLLSVAGVELPPAGRDISSTLPAKPLSDVTTISSTEYVEDESSSDLEVIQYIDGKGVSITGTKKVTYNLNITKTGYYKIVLLAKGGETADRNGIKVEADTNENINMLVYDKENVNKIELAFAKSEFYDYRVCTVHFEKGSRNITFSVPAADHEVIIKELRYANLEIPVVSEGVNVIKLKDYYSVIMQSDGQNISYGMMASNGRENSLFGYPATGAKYEVSGAIANSGGGTTALTYKLNVAQAGTYKVTAASWVGAYSPVTYEILIGDEVVSTGTTETYKALKKSEDTEMTDLILPAGEVELIFKASSVGEKNSYMYYFTLEKKN